METAIANGRKMNRKERLLAAALARRALNDAPGPLALAAIEASEGLADGEDVDAEAAFEALRKAGEKGYLVVIDALICGPYTTSRLAIDFAAENGLKSYEITEERQRHDALIHCITSNRTSADTSWLAYGAVRKIAEMIYAERAFDRMPLLADALEDSGCTEEMILAHCRKQDPHGRGCYVIDMLTGRK